MARTVYGVGINDASYEVTNPPCPLYAIWANMLKRCYYEPYLAANPTYRGCSVVEEWHSFNSFREWAKQHAWEGKCLDKDIKVQNCKVYSPDTCLFISQEVNKLLNKQAKNRGNYPTGVCFHLRDQVFHASVRKEGKRVHLGSFSTADEASRTYLAHKGEHVLKLALQSSNPDEKAGLIRISQQIFKGVFYE